MTDPFLVMLACLLAFVFGGLVTFLALWFFMGRKDEAEFAQWYAERQQLHADTFKVGR